MHHQKNNKTQFTFDTQTARDNTFKNTISKFSTITIIYNMIAIFY